ncbi:solute carrier family 22 member 18-like isoform X2 [Dreissena polymorpha]|uniref:Major facilitator superfamily (MFS) profile domain-containing protein n=1 Tax=Dreissena polymorpha TaxID=45954 RepID=A0A9D3Z0N7_DREPO|nr:solute carrier family 22 member 18-like isoform X2 [Dreissena polymorpha]KAH3709494.1 hypothetical protein DPMN_068957 [Dreissena polymorpha]
MAENNEGPNKQLLDDLRSGENRVHEYKHNIHVFRWTLNKVILMTHVNLLLYSTCLWIQSGTLPLAGAPLFGRFGDLFGLRAAMNLAFISSALSYLLLSMSSSVTLLFLSRLPALFMHAVQGSMMIVTDLGDVEKRTDALGKLRISYLIGMVLGPMIGGQITQHFSEEMAAFVACMGSILSIVLVLLFVPHRTKKVEVADKSGSALLDLSKWKELIFAPGTLFLLSLKMATETPISIFHSMFQVIALETFNLPADQNGFLMSYIGVLTMLVQGVGVGVLLRKVSENSILKWASFLMVWSYLSLAFVGSIPQLCMVLAPLTVGLASSNIVINSALTRTVSDIDTGSMLGLNMASYSLIRTVSPTIGGYMLQAFGFPCFGYLGFLLSLIVTIILFQKKVV